MISVAPGEGLFYSIIPVAQGDGKNIMNCKNCGHASESK
jgi:hypothetical protein